MKKLAIVITAVLCAAAAPAFAGGDKHMGDKHMSEMHMQNMKMMDTNKDGMISRDEFMRFHETKWNEMKKNSSGMVDMKDMHMMHDKMMKDDKSAKDKTR
ncbi:EF-hand domain-containing protein [Pseudoduganella sp. GCM10020061]|uniref:EF-hand domain-containing protein n=1 Tax=Pseudoduganella sp. GCM10020061 TaxID=3317345 RepID=UPI003630B2BF